MISLIVTLGLIGFVTYLITTYIPMPSIFKTAIYAIVAVFVILWLINILGVHDMPVPSFGR